jgi:hypothetical protein
MKIQYLLFLMIPFIVIANEIGDFAPLTIGNTWQYSKRDTVADILYNSYEHKWSTVTFVFLGSEIKSDTTLHIFQYKETGIDSVLNYGFNSEVTVKSIIDVDILRYDTLLEVSDTMIIKEYYNYYIFPIWKTHLVDSSLLTVENESKMLLVSAQPVGQYKKEVKYQQNIGLINLSFSSFDYRHGDAYMAFSLLSFNGTTLTKEEKPLLNNRSKQLTTIHKMYNPAFSRISIKNGSQIFNLNGKLLKR